MPRKQTLHVKRELDFEKLSKARDLLERAGIVGNPFATFLNELLATVVHDGPPDPYEVKKLLKEYARDFVDDMRTLRRFTEDHPHWAQAAIRSEEHIAFVEEMLEIGKKVRITIVPREPDTVPTTTKEAPRSANQDAPSAFQKTTSIAGYHGPTMNGGGSGRPLVS